MHRKGLATVSLEPLEEKGGNAAEATLREGLVANFPKPEEFSKSEESTDLRSQMKPRAR